MLTILPEVLKKSLGLFCLFLGAFIFFSQIFFPETTSATGDKIISPVGPGYFEELQKKKLAAFSFSELEPVRSEAVAKSHAPKVFYLTIPTLGIEKALVEVNSLDTTPDEKLGHFAGSALPGEIGNTFIYGHSTLPALYNPADYKTIFALLFHLKKGDEIFIDYGEEKQKYLVQGRKIVKPEEVDPFGLSHLGYSSLTLMTCTPPGATTDRLLVLAKEVY